MLRVGGARPAGAARGRGDRGRPARRLPRSAIVVALMPLVGPGGQLGRRRRRGARRAGAGSAVGPRAAAVLSCLQRSDDADRPCRALDQPPDHRARDRVRALGRDRHQQPTGGHRVAHQPAPRLRHVVGERRELLGVARLRRVPPATARRRGRPAARGRPRSRAPPRRPPRRRRRWPAPARAGGRAARTRSRRSSRGRPRPGRAAAPSRFSVVITSTASASGASRAPRLSAVDTAPAPSGLVSTSASPARPPALVITSSGRTTPVTASPYLGSASSIEWPPTIGDAGIGGHRGGSAQDLHQHVAAERHRTRTRPGSAR